MILPAAIAGAILLAGIVMVVAYFRPAPEKAPKRAKTQATLAQRWRRVSRPTRTRLLIGAAVGLVAALFTGIPLLLVVIPAAIVGLPLLLGKQDTREQQLILFEGRQPLLDDGVREPLVAVGIPESEPVQLEQESELAHVLRREPHAPECPKRLHRILSGGAPTGVQRRDHPVLKIATDLMDEFLFAAELPDEMKAFARRNALELSQPHFAQDVKKLAKVIQDAAPAKQNHKPRPDSETLSQKEAAIKQVRLDLVGATESPLYQFRVENRLFPVIGEGNPDANIVFIGEAPGKNEAAAGRPFIGPSGEVLAQMLESINLLREDVFVTNILLDRPPEKRAPTLEEIAFYEPFVDRILDIIQPAVIATLGRFAMQYILNRLDLPEKREPISKLHGKLIKARMHYGEVHIVPLYHPAVVLYSASQKATLQKDFEKLKLFI